MMDYRKASLRLQWRVSIVFSLRCGLGLLRRVTTRQVVIKRQSRLAKRSDKGKDQGIKQHRHPCRDCHQVQASGRSDSG